MCGRHILGYNTTVVNTAEPGPRDCACKGLAQILAPVLKRLNMMMPLLAKMKKTVVL